MLTITVLPRYLPQDTRSIAVHMAHVVGTLYEQGSRLANALLFNGGVNLHQSTREFVRSNDVTMSKRDEIVVPCDAMIQHVHVLQIYE